MNKTLLIHNNNVVQKDIFSDTWLFKLPQDDTEADSYISNKVIPKIAKEKYDVIYIKDSLSTNYLDLYGLRIAYHIRLSQNLGNLKFIPIVILSELDGFTLNILEPMAKIIFTKNIYFIQNDTTIKEFLQRDFQFLNHQSFIENFLKKIEVELPKDYLSHHAIANQWAIYRWAEFLKIDTPALQKNKATIENMLYFKYLLAKYPLLEKSGIKQAPKKTNAHGKVLYIDDEWAKGWSDIFKGYFAKQENITFKTLEEITKDTKYQELEQFVSQTIETYNPDLIILDMRLIQEDQQNINEKNISGIKILEHIKKNINGGIQVLMLSASGKSQILDEAHKYDILGYIKKEHPQDTATKTKETFEKLTMLLDIGLEKQYLKEIWSLQKEILDFGIFTKKQYAPIKIEIQSLFEILNSSMENRFIYAMLAIFKALEIMITFYIEEKKENNKRFAYWKDTGIKIAKVNQENFLTQTTKEDTNDTTENKIRVILHEKLNLKEKTLHDTMHQITQKRNKAIHDEMPSIDKEDILQWFRALKIVLRNLK